MDSENPVPETRLPELARVRVIRKNARCFPPHLKKSVESHDESFGQWIIRARSLREKDLFEQLSTREKSLLEQLLRKIQHELSKKNGYKSLSSIERQEYMEEALVLTDPNVSKEKKLFEVFTESQVARIRSVVYGVLERRAASREKYTTTLLQKISQDIRIELEKVKGVFDVIMDEVC
ncbi:MAG: hypothetical protein P1V18_03785 [Candidatus Gracilibacteria bacterium]|nr:hypothetical protein [Candidatus Gracilibacteria bacterium]